MIPDVTVSAYAIPGLKGKTNLQINRNSEDMVSYIESIVSDYFGENLKALRGKSRVRNKVLARFVIMYLLRKYTRLSLKIIGGRFNRDHTSVLHGCAALKNLMDSDEIINNIVQSLEAKIK